MGDSWFNHKHHINIYLWDGEYWYPSFIVKTLFY